MEGEGRTVCVTGGTGYLGSWLVKRLLELGYSVRTTVRPDPGGKRDISFLTSLPGASERLKVFTADLSEPDSFDAAIEGCEGVFNVAAPVHIEEKEPVEVVTRTAIEGTLGILKASLKAKTVKRVVHTTSTFAAVFNGKDVDPMDESYWSDVEYMQTSLNFSRSYSISKTLTEKAAFEFAEEHGLDLVTVIPSAIVGPFLCPKLPGSVAAVLAMILGKEDVYHYLINISMVHVDDVARAHIFLLDYPDAKGRYICSSDRLTIQQMAQFLSAEYPEYQIPNVDSLAEVKGTRVPGLSSEKLLATGFKYKYGLHEIYDDAIQSCKEKGYL